jgi:hypothetical protein
MGSTVTTLLDTKNFPYHLLPSHATLSPTDEAALRDVWLQFQIDHRLAVSDIEFSKERLRQKREELAREKRAWDKVAANNDKDLRECTERLIACRPNRSFDDTLALLRYIAGEEIKQLQRVHTDLEIEIRLVESEESIRKKLSEDLSKTSYSSNLECKANVDKRCAVSSSAVRR